MNKQIFINLPVSDLARSTAFYESLGFKKNPDFSDENGCALMWSDEIIVMILTHEFYQKFLNGRQVADTKRISGVLLALSMESKDAVTTFAETAKANGGDYYRVDMGVSEDMMFGCEVLDPDGNQWEPVWMSQDFNPRGASE